MPEPELGFVQSEQQTDTIAKPETQETQQTEQKQTPPEGSIGALFADDAEITQPKIPVEELPAKFQGKTVQDVAKSAMEAEKAMHAKAQEAADYKKQLEQAAAEKAYFAQQQLQQQQLLMQQQTQQTAQQQQAQTYIKQLADLQYTDPERYNAEVLRLQADLAEAKARAMFAPFQQFMAQTQAQQVSSSLVQAITAHPQYAAFKDVITQDAIFKNPTIQRELADITNGIKPLNQIDLGYLADVVLGTAAMRNPQVIEGQFKQFAANQTQAQSQARSLTAQVGTSRTGSAPTASLSQEQMAACKAMGINPADFAKHIGQV